jgi:rubrerythrin
MSTQENLASAFAGESQANRKYLAFAGRAEKEGFVNVAKLFRATAHAETIHAMSHLRAMKAVNTTEENLAGAMAGEEFEFKNMYPKFIEEATTENAAAANISFKNAMAVEQVHYSLYSAAMNRVKAGEDLTSSRIYVCQICGHTVLDETPEKCPICNAAKKAFTEIE